jgi:outer membrane protein assembly factor BamD (BamD/ComL family)
MKVQIKTSYRLSSLLPFLLICLLQSDVNAQDFLKKFLSNSLIKEGKQIKSDGNYPSAITKFTKSIKREPNNLEAYYQLGLIFEEVMYDFDKAISLYKNVIRLSDGVKPVGTDEELKEFNSLITNARTSIDRTIGKKFESIEKPKVPVYIMVKPYQKISKEPKLLSFSIHKTTSYASEFKLLEFSNNWYQINVPSTGKGWVNGKNILKIIQKEEKAIETSPTGKAALYQRFVDQYPDSRFAQNAKDKADDIYYGLAKEEDSINSYSMYLKNNPDGKYSKKVQLKKDELTFEDDDFLNNINRLKNWITNNSESTFIGRAKNRIDELTFAQAKYDNNTVSLEGYIIDYPDGKFVSEAKQLIEEIKYNHAKLINTVVSYKKYMEEYPDGKYADHAVKRIDEKEFRTLLDSKDINLLAEHLESETNEERIKLVKNRIEELYFKKAEKAVNDIESIKMHEDYLQKYPEGQYAQKAETRIEELSFNIATKTNTKESYSNFIKKYPQSKRYKEAIDGIVVLDFNVALSEDTIESFRIFLMTYPDGKFAQKAKKKIEELAFEDAKTEDTINAYKEFIIEYPDSHLAITAKNLIETGYFESASHKGTVGAYKEYVELYPDGSHLEKALLVIDMLTFKPYDEKGSVRGLKKFIKKYPDNRYVKDALAKIDQLNFEYYQKRNTLSAYKKFVTKYPDNRYVNKARQKIILLQPSNIGKKSGSGFPYLLMMIIFSCIGIAVAGVLNRKRIACIVQSWQQGYWSCECGTRHNKDVENCSVCKNTRSMFNKASLTGSATRLKEKSYEMYEKLPEKEVIVQKTKDIQAKAINTVGKMKEYHDRLEKENEEKYQKVKEEPVSSESDTKSESKIKPTKDKAKIYSKPSSAKGISIISYFMSVFIPFVYFFSRKRTTAGIVSLVICLVSIPFMFIFIGIFSYFAMSFWACWNLRYELMQEYATMQAEAMAKKLVEIKKTNS